MAEAEELTDGVLLHEVVTEDHFELRWLEKKLVLVQFEFLLPGSGLFLKLLLLWLV